MAILVFQHGDDATSGVGRLGPILRDHGFSLDIRRVDLAENAGGRPVPGDYDNVQGIISLGGPMNVADAPSLPWMQKEMAYLRGAHERRLPVIGLCLGHQMLAAALGGEVAPAVKPEWGYCPVNITVPGQTDVMLAGIAWSCPQFQCHFKEVTKVPDGATVLASSPACKVQAFRVGQRSYGFQYHFEYTRGQIEGFTRDGRCQKEMAEAGLTASDLAKQISEHHETFERLGERLCRNIATLMFPVSRKLRG